MKKAISTLLFFFTILHSQAQGENPRNITTTNSQNSWHNVESGRLTALPSTTLDRSQDSIALTLSFSNFIIDISSRDGNLFIGSVVLNTSTYDPYDHKSLYSKKYYQQTLLNPDTARMIYKLFSDSKVATIPTDKDIKGWRPGNDGLTYFIQYKTGSHYTSKSYWSPEGFKDIPEAVVIDRFVTEASTLLNVNKRWNNFLAILPKGKSYHRGGISVVTVAEYPANTNWINQISVTYQEADEPPVVGGRPLNILSFERNDADLVATYFTKGNSKIALEDTLTLHPSLVQTIMDWAKDKSVFTLRELDLKNEAVKKAASNTSKNKLVFGMPEYLLVNIDSMTFCKQYIMQRTMSTGIDRVSVSVMYSNKSKVNFEFEANDLVSGFDLKAYLTCYLFLYEAIIPDEFPAAKFFEEDKLIQLLYEYQKITECEGYYYREYTSKHPELSARDRRMMKGWDFIAYMKQVGRTPKQ